LHKEQSDRHEKESNARIGHRALAESVFDREHVGEREQNDALKLKEVRRAAVVENMRRLRALRLAQNKEH
jgi:hypothetical protein